MLKAVLDTNVIVSGLNFPTSNPAKILILVASGEVANFTSRHIVNETRRILVDKFFWTREKVEAAEVWLKTFSKSVNPKNRISVIDDDPDNRILVCAVEGQADFIISGDHHLTDLKNYQGIKILAPSIFLALIAKLNEE
ncbi:MAG: putative toxin-antitoxin system toxin component, PIN family [Deltaproteobacteria bacterium]|nr:putative toxin-antitoxin system toxin component, PIN family [Deltaproteobacteria bacterium]MBM4300163.1 putative toxin-antitoxin system toxin component, PIN family [Deltaproteobacteria bacterium]